MLKYKKIIAGVLAISMVFSITSCNSKDSSSNSEDNFSATDNVKVEDTNTIKSIPDGAEKELVYLGVDDLNPTKGNPEISTQLALFQSKGGSIKFSKTTYMERFDKLATAITSGTDVPDIVNYEWLSFPSQIIKEMYKPIDSIVDFDTELWKDVKETAEQFMFNDKHYVVPLSFEASSMLAYDKAIIDSEGLEDPYELYVGGEWNWDNWIDIMSEYVGNATGEGQRYGVNGFFKQHFVQQTGKTLVNFDKATNTFSSNLKDPDIEKAQEKLYQMKKNNLILNEWVGSARDAFNKGCLFYAMGAWGYSGNNSPKQDEEWGVVPIPQSTDNPQKITTSDMKAFMWVNGSKKDEAVKCWFECYRIANTNPKYMETTKEKFMENNPYWTPEMYDVKMDIISSDYLMLFDYAYGVSSALGDVNSFDGNSCLVDALYTYSSSDNEEGVQPTWSSIREQYSATVDTEVNNLNASIKEFIEKNK